MNWDRIEGNWKQWKGEVRKKWGKLTDDDLDQIKGEAQRLQGKLQERYGIEKEDAERQVSSWLGSLEDRADRSHRPARADRPAPR